MPEFDVFLSHNSVDKPWVIQLKEALLRYGVSVWLDKDAIRPGDLSAQALEEGLQHSRAIVLVVSPEAMASGWVREEYYRALSLAHARQPPLQLIPVILRDAEVPGFLQSRNLVDFQDQATYARNVWELVWGITGQQPAQVLDVAVSAPLPGVNAQTARKWLALAQEIQSGSVAAGQDLMARLDFQYLGRGDGTPNREQFQQELSAIRAQLGQAIAAGEIAETYDAEDAQKAVDRALEQARADAPAVEKITDQLERAATLIHQAARQAEASDSYGATVITLAPLVLALTRLASVSASRREVTLEKTHTGDITAGGNVHATNLVTGVQINPIIQIYRTKRWHLGRGRLPGRARPLPGVAGGGHESGGVARHQTRWPAGGGIVAPRGLRAPGRGGPPRGPRDPQA